MITFTVISMQRTLGNLFLDRHAFSLFYGSRRSLKLKPLENLGENLGEKLTSKEITIDMDFFFERMGIVQCRICDIPLIRIWGANIL